MTAVGGHQQQYPRVDSDQQQYPGSGRLSVDVYPGSGRVFVDVYAGSGRSSTLMVVNELQKQVRDRDALLERCAAELRDLRQQLSVKEAELSRLRAEVNKFQSVLDAKSPVPGAGPLGVRMKSDLLATINEEALMMGQESRQKKQGVSGESAQTGHGVQEIKHYDKDFKYVQSNNVCLYAVMGCRRMLHYYSTTTLA